MVFTSYRFLVNFCYATDAMSVEFDCKRFFEKTLFKNGKKGKFVIQLVLRH